MTQISRNERLLLMTDAEFIRDVLQRIATGPTLSKDISRDEACRAMQIILDGQADEVQAGIFLIALRMKRETDDELAGVLEAINQGITPQAVAVEHLLTIVDPYDGYLRSTPVAPFLAPVLAACGLKVLTHGVMSMGPKFGASHEGVLQAAGYEGVDDLQSAAQRLEDPHCGWVYVSQSVLAPRLAALSDLRTRIVKRPCLTTLEVAVSAFQPQVASHLVTGFVHKPYPPVYALMAREGGFASSMCVRGVEGGVVPSLTQASRYFTSSDGTDLQQVDMEPPVLGIEREERAVPLPEVLRSDEVRSVKAPGNRFAQVLSEYAAGVGLLALQGEAGYARDSLVYAGACILQARGVCDSLADGAERVRGVLDDGTALRCFSAGRGVSLGGTD